MTLLYTRIYDSDDAAAALEAGADRAYMGLVAGFGFPPANISPGCLCAVELGPQFDLASRLPRQDWPETLIGIVPAADPGLATLFAEEGFKTLLLAPGGRLLKAYEPGFLRNFISICQAQNLNVGFGGQIEAPDIPRLLLLEPDFLVFPSDEVSQTNPPKGVDKAAIALARDLIRSFEAGSNDAITLAGDAAIAMRPQSRRDPSAADIESSGTDRLFVHDLVLPASIGAYRSETTAPQRIRLNVDLAIRRQVPRSQDMRDIFSYDLIVDTIKLILGRGHVQFIETLAEEIAGAMLVHPRVATAKVRVEKLDIFQACAGIEIFRERLSESAEVTQLFSEPEVKSGSR